MGECFNASLSDRFKGRVNGKMEYEDSDECEYSY